MITTKPTLEEAMDKLWAEWKEENDLTDVADKDEKTQITYLSQMWFFYWLKKNLKETLI